MTRFTPVFVVAFGFAVVGSVRAQDMPLSQVLLDEAAWEVVSTGHSYTEGPATDAVGNVYFSDVPQSKIYKIDLAGKVSLFADQTARTNGLMFARDGRLFGCRMEDRQIVAYRPDGKHDVIASEIDPNDLAVTSTGGVYCSDPTHSRIWWIDSAGERRVVAEGFKPNGIILWADEQTLVVTDAVNPWLWTFRVEADGSLSFPDKYYGPLRLDPRHEGTGSDGMTVDKDGRLYVATHAGLQMFDPTGRMGGVILKPQNKKLSNATFGGPELSFLYVTCSDKVYRRRTKTSGVARLAP